MASMIFRCHLSHRATATVSSVSSLIPHGTNGTRRGEVLVQATAEGHRLWLSRVRGANMAALASGNAFLTLAQLVRPGRSDRTARGDPRHWDIQKISLGRHPNPR
jgi:hypothetical protein